MKKVST